MTATDSPPQKLRSDPAGPVDRRGGPGARPLRDFDAVEHFHQPEGGYRFSADSILLADFVRAEGSARAADFGAGCGVVGLVALEKGRAAGVGRFFFVERAPEMREPLTRNVELYRKRTSADLVIIPGDWRVLTPKTFGGPLDYVMANPPYFAAGSGRPGRNPHVDAARRETDGDLGDLLRSLAGLLAPGGRVALVLPAARREELRRLWREHGFEPTRLETVPPEPVGRARLALAEARRR